MAPIGPLIRVNEAIGQGLLELFQLLHPKADLEVLQRLELLKYVQVLRRR